MSPNGNATAANGGVNVQKAAEAPNNTILSLIGATVEFQLEDTLWKLVSGGVELHQLTPALQAWWAIAYSDGFDARKNEIARLNAENDRLYLRAWNPPAKVHEIIQLRLTDHFEREAARFYGQVSA